MVKAMEVDLFIYGTPFGADFWGKKEDKAYFDALYDGSSDKQKLLIQTRVLNGTPYCYYNYLVYENVVDTNGRSGGFFGISLRFNAYCNDVAALYRILDTVFNMSVVGNILEVNKSKLRYVVSNFANASKAMKQIETVTLQLIRYAFSANSFSSLAGFSVGTGKCPISNLYDCTNDNVLSAVKQYGKLAVSPFYPNSKESALRNNYEKTITALKEQISQLQKDVAAKDKKIGQYQTEYSHLKAQIKSAEQTKQLSSIIAPIQAPIAELAGLFQQINPAKGGSSQKSGQTSAPASIKAFLPFINFILLAIITIFLCFSGTKEKTVPNDDTPELLDKELSQDSFKKDKPSISDISIYPIGEAIKNKTCTLLIYGDYNKVELEEPSPIGVKSNIIKKKDTLMFTPYKDTVMIKYRVDGELKEYECIVRKQ